MDVQPLSRISALPSPRPQRLLLNDAADAYVQGAEPNLQDHLRAMLSDFDAFLGTPAPLLAYTPLTGDAWLRTLPEHEQRGARLLLSAFRAFLRDGGWLDAARPVNEFD